MCFTYKQNILCLKHSRLSPDILGAPSWLSFEAEDSHASFSLCLFPSFLPSLPPFLPLWVRKVTQICPTANVDFKMMRATV